MRIEAITGRKIIVELSPEDMDHLDITYESLDYASVETRRVIWIILDQVRENTGCDIDPSGQLLIDAMPRPTGGCILFFTIRGGCCEAFPPCEPAERVLRKQGQVTVTFEFAGANALLDCAGAYTRGLRSESERLFSQSELYRKGERYRLLLCPAQELSVVKQFFSEYAHFYGEDSFAADRTREHWLPLSGSSAFEALSGQSPQIPPSRAATGFTPGNVYTEARSFS